MKNFLASGLFFAGILISLFSCKNFTPYERASANSGLTITEEMKIDSLVQEDGPELNFTGDYEFTAVVSYPDSLSKRVIADAQRSGFVNAATIKDSVSLFMERYVSEGDAILFSHKTTEHLEGNKYVIINLTAKKIIIYAFQN